MLTGLGEDLLLLLRSEQAIAPLERAVALGASKEGSDNAELAWARFTLARAMWSAKRDRERAVALAEQARGVYEQKPWFARQRRRIEAWLKDPAQR